MSLQDYQYMAQAKRNSSGSGRKTQSISKSIAESINDGDIVGAKDSINKRLYEMAADILKSDSLLRESVYNYDDEEEDDMLPLNMQVLGGYDDEEEEDMLPLNMQVLGGYDDEEEEEDMLPLNMSMGGRRKRKSGGWGEQAPPFFGDDEEEEEDMMPLNMSMGGRRKRRSGGWGEQFKTPGRFPSRTSSGGGRPSVPPRPVGGMGGLPSRNIGGGLPGRSRRTYGIR